MIGRPLEEREVVHHIDLNAKNNDPTNLYLFHEGGEHIGVHNGLRRITQTLIRNGLIEFEDGQYQVSTIILQELAKQQSTQLNRAKSEAIA